MCEVRMMEDMWGEEEGCVGEDDGGEDDGGYVACGVRMMEDVWGEDGGECVE